MPVSNLLGHVLIFLTYKIRVTIIPNLQVYIEIPYNEGPPAMS